MLYFNNNNLFIISKNDCQKNTIFCSIHVISKFLIKKIFFFKLCSRRTSCTYLQNILQKINPIYFETIHKAFIVTTQAHSRDWHKHKRATIYMINYRNFEHCLMLWNKIIFRQQYIRYHSILHKIRHIQLYRIEIIIAKLDMNDAIPYACR